MRRPSANLTAKFKGLLCATTILGGAHPAMAAAATDPQSDQASVSELSELIVTAQKRSENMQDVPTSVSVVTSRQLADAHATQLTDYAAYTPGFQVDTRGTPGQAQITLRGVAAAISSGPTVGTYIDDTPVGSSSIFAQGSSFQLDLMPYDVSRIEVLRGPQGTLYGASTMGGLLKYVLKAPNSSAFSAQAGSEVFTIRGGGGLGVAFRGAVNVPLVADRLAVRVSFYDQRSPGYIDNAANGDRDENAVEQAGGRIAIAWQATPNLTVGLNALVQETDADGSASVTYDTVSYRRGVTLGAPAFGPLATAHVPPTPYHGELQFFAATLDQDFGWAHLLSATSVSKTRSRINIDFSQTFGATFPFFCSQDPTCTAANPSIAPGIAPLHTKLNLEKVTQELRLASPQGGKFEWLFGAFYTDESVAMTEQVSALDSALKPIVGLDPLAEFGEPSTYHEYAVFADATYRFNEQFDVTVGGRVSRNRQKSTVTSRGALTGVSASEAKSTEDDFTYMISPRFRLNSDVMAYGRIASGYRPGGPNLPYPGVPAKADSDSLVDYELGVKSELFEHRLVLNASVFRIDWKDIQVTGITPDGINYNTNGGTARSQGVEASSTFAPTQHLRFAANLAYTDAHLTQDVPSISGRSGDRLPLSARWGASLTGEYETALPRDWIGRAGLGYRYVGDRYSEVPSSPSSARLPGYSVVEAHATLSNARWTVTAFVKNLGDERAALSTITDRSAGQLLVNIMQPRTFGVSLDAAF